MNSKENFIMQDIMMQLKQIDYLEVLRIVQPIIVYYITSRTLTTYSLHSDYKPQKISKVFLPPELTVEHSEVDTERVAAQIYGEHILNFADVMIKNFPTTDLVNFYNNINGLETKIKDFKVINFILKARTSGNYDVEKNAVSVSENVADIGIYHELFHMSSSVVKEKKKYSGFHQTDFKTNLGRGINEGYTELLTNRYFPSLNLSSIAYQYEAFVAERLEQIVGREKMQSLYLNANLKGLIDELSEYISEDEIMKFISNNDFLIQHMGDKKLALFEKKMMSNCLRYVNRFLIFCFSKMLIKQVKEGKFSTNAEIIPILTTYVKSLHSEVEFNNHSYLLMDSNDIEEVLRAAFENDKITVTIANNNEESIKR